MNNVALILAISTFISVLAL